MRSLPTGIHMRSLDWSLRPRYVPLNLDLLLGFWLLTPTILTLTVFVNIVHNSYF